MNFGAIFVDVSNVNIDLHFIDSTELGNRLFSLADLVATSILLSPWTRGFSRDFELHFLLRVKRTKLRSPHYISMELSSLVHGISGFGLVTLLCYIRFGFEEL
jgi:hypothetical protein